MNHVIRGQTAAKGGEVVRMPPLLLHLLFVLFYLFILLLCPAVFSRSYCKKVTWICPWLNPTESLKHVSPSAGGGLLHGIGGEKAVMLAA
ncbi:hypothetical protein BDV25DRAFT_165572 [Aspergillus avenaceus]|uniref:Uncharacterized protein n=1 Tax=Aspergillus avenaceus TaxID=36643 RepID=A0A5N6TF72_ASPAV|nr:hypothetical protein BDV25DRAFT_165572 [Aspergillus avenaceus]